MPSIYELKPRFQKILRPSVERLQSAGFTANQVTVAAAALSILSGCVIALFIEATEGRAGWYLWLYPVVLFTRMALNAIDGMLAREFNQKSDLGAYLNELGDIVSDAGLYLPLGLINGVAGPLVVAVVVGGILTEFTGVMGCQFKAGRRYDGPMGKSDRAVLVGALAAGMAVGIINPFAANLVLIGALVLLGMTLRNRVSNGLKGIPETDNNLAAEKSDV